MHLTYPKAKRLLSQLAPGASITKVSRGKVVIVKGNEVIAQGTSYLDALSYLPSASSTPE